MLRGFSAVCVLLVIVTSAGGQTVVPHATNVTGWRGGNNHSANYCWMDAWPSNGSWGGYQDATLADFDRAALQSAINSAIDAYGGWDAKVLVTQPDWMSAQDPKVSLPNLGPVLGSAQVDAGAIDWPNAQSFSAGLGSWAVGGTTYSTFGAAVLAGVPSGKSVVFDTIPWTTEGGPSVWHVVMNAPENLLVEYMKNTSATGLFASAKTPYNAYLGIYQNQNTSQDIRVRIDAPPAGAPWMNAVIDGNAHTLWVARTIVQGSGATVVNVQVNNARTGTLAWTAAESPDATWLTLAGASGGNGGTFQMTLSPVGLAVGTYSTAVVITDNASTNKTVTIPVLLTIQSAQPVIQPSPASLAFKAAPAGANPAPQTVTVNNSGSGTLAWTAAENPDVSWLSISPTAGGNGGTFTVTVNKTGLAANVYTATIRITDAGASNSPQNVTVTLTVADQDADIAKANSYDDAWEGDKDGWAASMWHLRLNATGKNAGFVVFLGDSITYSSAYGAWARSGSGKNALDNATCTWTHANTGSSQATNDGWYLAKYDVPNRNGSYTARSGITAGGYLTGYAAPDLPGMDKMFSVGFTNPDGKQYRDAEMAVILLGTNDIGSNNAAALTANLGSIIDKLVAVKVIPVLTTLPPRSGADATVASYNTAIRNLAQSRKIPLIDFWTEVTRRRPGTTWQNTLVSGDGVHPSGDRAGYTVSSDPYANSGAALSEVGYLLRTWITVQKIAEIKAKVWDVKPGDFNADNSCDVIDLLTFVESFGLSKGNANYDQRCDFDGNDSIDVIDLLDFIPYFGT